MLTARRLATVLTLGLSALLFSPRPDPIDPGSTRRVVALAEEQKVAGRIDFYLPPARVAPPMRVPARRKRSWPARVAPVRAVAPMLDLPAGTSLPAASAPPVRLLPRPGLFTVSRIGNRLLYRKGYMGEVPVHLVVADLNDPEIKIGVMVARGGVGSTERLDSMVARARPAAALTGTFFGLSNSLPTGDLVVNGRAVYQGFVGTAVAFTEGNVISFIPTGYKEKTAWRFFDGVLRAGPLLVQQGRIAVGPREEGFVSLSPAARRPRTAVGVTPGRKLLLLAVEEPVSLWRLAELMRELDAYHAVAMDGGTSTGLYYRGQMVVRPGRALTNALVVYAYQRHYQEAKRTFLTGEPARPAAKPPLAAGPHGRKSAPAIRIDLAEPDVARPPTALPDAVPPAPTQSGDVAPLPAEGGQTPEPAPAGRGQTAPSAAATATPQARKRAGPGPVGRTEEGSSRVPAGR